MEDIVPEINFSDRPFPRKYTCDGENVSPPIRLSGVLSPYLAVLVEDPVGPDRWFTHWIIWNIPAGELIPEHVPHGPVITLPVTAVQGRNDFGKTGYGGPCPPPGGDACQHFQGLRARLPARYPAGFTPQRCIGNNERSRYPAQRNRHCHLQKAMNGASCSFTAPGNGIRLKNISALFSMVFIICKLGALICIPVSIERSVRNTER